MALRVELTAAARRDLKRLSRTDLARVDAAILALAGDPHPRGSLKLRGERSLYRVRVGSLRVLYQLEAGCVVIARVRDRREAYR